MSNKIDYILEHISTYCNDIKTTVQRFGDNVSVFLGDKDYQRSVCFNMLQIGELVKHLPMDYRTQNPQVPWKQICGLRDIVAHAYGDVDLNLIFKNCHNNIDELLDFCEQQLQNSSDFSDDIEDEPEFEP